MREQINASQIRSRVPRGRRRRVRPSGPQCVAGALAVLGLQLVLTAQPAPALAEEEPPLNVILISLDTVRPDHLSCYGYARQTTPNLDRIAEEGVVFTQAIAQGTYTVPSHYAMFTSEYPDPVDWDKTLSPEGLTASTTLTDILKTQGYKTVAFSGMNVRAKGPSSILRHTPLFQAFDYHQAPVHLTWLPNEFYGWLYDSMDEPFFLFLHGYDAHEPHLVHHRFDGKRFNPDYQGRLVSTRSDMTPLIAHENPELLPWTKYYMKHLADQLDADGRLRPEDLEHLKAVYDAQLYYMDRGLGELFTALRNLDLIDRTLIVIVSDHGQSFGEHGEYATHGDVFYDEVIRSVLIVRDPRARKRGIKVNSQVQLVDVMPTILDRLGLSIPVTAVGRSLVPFLDTGRDSARDEVAIIRDSAILEAIRTPQWKLILRDGSPTELFQIATDPGEQHNVLADKPDVVQTLNDRLRRILAATGKSYTTTLSEREAFMQKHGYW